MHIMMFQAQASWVDQQTDHAALLRTFTEEVGWRVAAWVADPATRTRTGEDFGEVQAMGVQGTLRGSSPARTISSETI